jgi:hypothetical protein
VRTRTKVSDLSRVREGIASHSSDALANKLCDSKVPKVVNGDLGMP